MISKESIDCPIWVSDHDEIHNLLSQFIGKMDKGTRLLIRLTPMTAPALFDYNNPESDMVWSLIQLLEQEHRVLSIELEKQRPDKEIYDNAKIRFNPESENLVRRWLGRPKRKPYKVEWRLAVESLEWNTSTDVSYIATNPLKYWNIEAGDMAAQLLTTETSLSKPKTLREISAAYFWGDSKFLDSRQEYLESAFPHQKENILTRPVLVNAYIPESFTSVLFIENQDTFLMLASNLVAMSETGGTKNTMAIVYTAGYRGSAARIRDYSGYVISAVAQTSPKVIDRFTQWWELKSDDQIPTFFWGDLDYSGLAILSALRGIFKGMTVWRPGYDAMLLHHGNNVSHPISSANKGAQKDPGQTGCPYSDDILLPAIRMDELFVDQEIVSFPDIAQHLTMKNFND